MNNDKLNKIFDKTDGHCHICHGKLCFTNYGIHGAKGAWEVEHSKAKKHQGTNHLNNLFAAHISCNREKGTLHARTARAYYGNSRAPYSKAKKEKIQTNNTITGTVVGGTIGSFFGPVGIFVGAGIGALIGNDSSPKK
jgi:5-methylcytosine-specific restriction endonuclease McrA